jgi:hypothetical protein
MAVCHSHTKYGTGTCRPGFEKEAANESGAAGQRCVNVNARYASEALWHEARCSIVNVVVNENDNENEKKKKKRSRDPRARWAETFVVLLVAANDISTC